MNIVKDLSQYHYLLSDFFKNPVNDEEWDQYKLTAEQVEFFHEKIILKLIAVFSFPGTI